MTPIHPDRPRHPSRSWRELVVPRLLPLAASLLTPAVLAVTGCDRSPEANGGPRVFRLRTEPSPYPDVPDLPVAKHASVTDAEHFVVVEGNELLRLGRRGEANTIEVSTDELLRAFWRLRGDPLGGRGAATPDAAPLLLAGESVPARRVMEVVSALWKHGARLAVAGGPPGPAREHPVRMLTEPEPGPGQVEAIGASEPTVELGPRGLTLSFAGEDARPFEGCGPSPDTACLSRVLDTAADSGARTVLLRHGR